MSRTPRRTSRGRPAEGSAADERLATWIIIAGALALAFFTYFATAGASSANGDWQDAVRSDARRSAATLENIRTVYEDEAPLALSITASLVRAQELDRRAGAGSFLGVQADAERETAGAYLDTFRREVPDSPVTRLLGSGEDPEAVARTHPLGGHLATLQASSGRAADDATTSWTTGDRAAKWTRAHLWGMVAAALVVLAGFVLWERRRRPPAAPTTTAARPPGSWPGVALGVAALIGGRDGPGRRPLPARLLATVLAGAAIGGVLLHRTSTTTVARAGQEDAPAVVLGPPAAPAVPPDRPAPDADPGRSPLPSVCLAVAAVVVTALQIDASTTENQYLAEAARGADRVGTVTVGSGPREAFRSNGQQLVVRLQRQADSTADAGRSATVRDRAVADALAAADRDAAARIDTAVADLAVPPTTADGLDSLSAAAVSASEFAREPEQRAQATAAAAAEVAGDRSDGFVLALLALTLAANCVEIGHSSRMRAAGPSIVNLGWVLAAGAAVLTATTLSAG